MKKEELLNILENRYKDIHQMFTYREYSYFYNPNNILPRGVYFATIKESDGINDKASNLDRDGVYRLSFGLSKKTYERLFGAKPKRPLKGKIVDTRDDFTAFNILTPHPIYAWMGWVQILNPKLEQLSMITELLDERYEIVKNEFSKKIIRKIKA
jgi:hypothetical protein